MKNLLALFFALVLGMAQAYETKSLRVSYMNRYGDNWSRSQNVNAYILSGSELNEVTYGYHSPINHYAVIPWRSNSMSVIEMQGFYSPGGMIIGMRGVDQNGARWKLDDSYGICY